MREQRLKAWQAILATRRQALNDKKVLLDELRNEKARLAGLGIADKARLTELMTATLEEINAFKVLLRHAEEKVALIEKNHDESG